MRCIAIACVLVLAGCATSARAPDDLIGLASSSEFGSAGYGCEDTIAVAKAAGVDYRAVVAGCVRRDARSMHVLFDLTANAGFDAASSEGNAAVLGAILRHVGDADFGGALGREPAATQASVRDAIRYDFGVANGNVRESWMREWYPITFAAGTERAGNME